VRRGCGDIRLSIKALLYMNDIMRQRLLFATNVIYIEKEFQSNTQRRGIKKVSTAGTVETFGAPGKGYTIANRILAYPSKRVNNIDSPFPCLSHIHGKDLWP